MTGCCQGGTRLIYSCSGGADVGQIADKVARRLAKDGFGKMTCLAAMGAHLAGFVQSAIGAEENIAIDGCPVACARKVLEHIDVPSKSFIMTEMGFEKGKTLPSEDIVNDISEKIKQDNTTISQQKDANDSGSCCC